MKPILAIIGCAILAAASAAVTHTEVRPPILGATAHVGTADFEQRETLSGDRVHFFATVGKGPTDRPVEELDVSKARPPLDPACEGGIEYWEIWNEPDLRCDAKSIAEKKTWTGTDEQFNAVGQSFEDVAQATALW